MAFAPDPARPGLPVHGPEILAHVGVPQLRSNDRNDRQKVDTEPAGLTPVAARAREGGGRGGSVALSRGMRANTRPRFRE